MKVQELEVKKLEVKEPEVEKKQTFGSWRSRRRRSENLIPLSYFFMFLFKVLSGTFSYLDIFVLIHWWFANIWLYTLSSLSPSLTSLHGVNSKLVPRKFQLRAVTMLPCG